MTVSVASSNISRTSLVDSEKASSDTSPSATAQLASPPQPFTELLVEATSKVLRDGLEKAEMSGNPTFKEESKKAVDVKDTKEERPETRSKKDVSTDKSIPPVPIIAPPHPLIVVESTPVAVPVIAPLAKEVAPKQAKVEALTTIDIQDSRPTAPILNVDLMKDPVDLTKDPVDLTKDPVEFVKDPGIEKSARSENDSPVSVLAAPPQMVHVDHAKPVATPDQPTILTTEPAELATVDRDIRAVPSPVVNDLVPEFHASPPLPSKEEVIHHREAPARAGDDRSNSSGESIAINISLPAKESINTKGPITTKESTPAKGSVAIKEPVSGGDHISPSLVRSEQTEPDAVPFWPLHFTIAAPAVNPASRIASPSIHPLDVGALVGAISRPLDEARGGYTVVIAMHPVELGHVQAIVTLHGIDLHVSITPQTQMGHDALTHAVDTLKTELSRGGVNVNVTLQDPSSQPRGENRPQVTPPPREVFASEDSVVTPPAPPVLSTNQVNLVL